MYACYKEIIKGDFQASGKYSRWKFRKGWKIILLKSESRVIVRLNLSEHSLYNNYNNNNDVFWGLNVWN